MAARQPQGISQLTESGGKRISSLSTRSEAYGIYSERIHFDDRMKAFSFSVLAGLVLAVSAGSASAQNYSIDWYKIAGGGGTSSNGQFTLSGTIGQHDSGGPMVGGSFSLTGGFWSLLSVVQSVGSPTIRIFLTTSNTAVVAWPTNASGFTLQQNSVLGTSGWTTSGSPIVVGSENQVVIAPPAGRQFYRLVHP